MNIPLAPVGIVALTLLLGGCHPSQGGSSPAPPAAGLPAEDVTAAVPLGQLAGVTGTAIPALSIANPYNGNAQAIEAGHALFIKMNCAGCHAYAGTGNMGPDLTDQSWRYGGFPIEIYQSIHDGRPQGMPAWGSTLPPQDIWQLVAYIQSLGGTFSPPNAPVTLQSDQPGEQVAPESHETSSPATPANTQPVSADVTQPSVPKP